MYPGARTGRRSGGREKFRDLDGRTQFPRVQVFLIVEVWPFLRRGGKVRVENPEVLRGLNQGWRTSSINRQEDAARGTSTRVTPQVGLRPDGQAAGRTATRERW